MLRPLTISRARPAAWLIAGLVAASTATGQDAPPAIATPLPIPQAALQYPDAELTAADAASPMVPVVSDTDAVVFNPALAAIGRVTSESGAHLRARASIPVDIIRNGFAARDGITTADQARSVGFKLGRDVFSLSTSLNAPAEPGAARDARIDWKWAQPVSAATGLVWGVSTGGSGAVGSNPEQTGDVTLGYRQQLLPHLLLTTQLGMAGNYVFATGDGFHSALTPQVSLSVDLARAADLPWQASFDLSLARKLPLVASDYQTQGTALFSLRYTLQ